MGQTKFVKIPKKKKLKGSLLSSTHDLFSYKARRVLANQGARYMAETLS